MNRTRVLAVAAIAALTSSAHAAEITVRNDSITDFGTATIVSGFVVGEEAASWLTSPCDGNVRAVQIFWRSFTGTTGAEIQSAIDILRAGTFPTPGAVAQTIAGPVLTDGVLNEWRHIDENQVIPVNVPVTANETFVVSLRFATTPPGAGPSVVRDNDGITASRNAIRANFGGTFIWFNAATLGLTGDWVIRAVVDCPVVSQDADVSVALSAIPTNYTPGAALAYTLTVSNAGPVAAPGTTVVDIFPPALTNVAWTCSGSNGGTCAASGIGNISQLVNLPAGAAVEFDVSTTVAPATTGTISNSATAVVAGGITDPQPGNNTITLETTPVPQADVAVGLSADPASYTPGAALDYTLVVNNAGPGAAAGTTVVDIFPPALTGVSWSCTGSNGATCPASGNGNLSLQVDLPAGGEVVFEVTGTVAAGTTATLSNSLTAVVPGTVIDPVPGNNSASLDTPRIGEADIGVSLDADLAAYLAGQALGFSLIVDNAGPEAAPGTQVVTLLPTAYTGIAWTCTPTAGVACTASGNGDLVESVDLPAGGSATFEFIGSVVPGTTGILVADASATVVAALLDPDLANNSRSIEIPEGSQTIGIFADGFED